MSLLILSDYPALSLPLGAIYLRNLFLVIIYYDVCVPHLLSCCKEIPHEVWCWQ